MSPRTSLAACLLSIAALGGLVLYLHAHDAAQLAALSRAMTQNTAAGDRGGAPQAVRVAAAAQGIAAQGNAAQGGAAQGGAAQGVDAAMVDAIAARVASRLRTGDGGAVRDAATGSAAAPAAPAETFTADQHAALDRASQLVDRVLDNRRLTRDDVRALRAQLAQVDDPATTTAVYRRLIVALNTSQVALEQPDLLTAR